jgi:hypothetical protein
MINPVSIQAPPVLLFELPNIWNPSNIPSRHVHLPSISTTNDVFMENNSEDEDEDNFINAVDEVNGQMQQRLMDIHDNDDDDDIYEEIDEDGAINP